MKRCTLLLSLLPFILACNNTPDSVHSDKTYEGELILTKHAKCRMECRHIDEREIREVLQNGKENRRKSDPSDRPCPTKALEGITSDQQEIRIIVAECENAKKIVTVIDLGTDWECACK